MTKSSDSPSLYKQARHSLGRGYDPAKSPVWVATKAASMATWRLPPAGLARFILAPTKVFVKPGIAYTNRLASVGG